MNGLLKILVIFAFMIQSLTVFSASDTNKSIPTELKPWVPWVNKHLDFIDCPMFNGGQVLSESDRACIWPATLEFKVSRTRAEIEQNWRVYKDSWIPLPGDQQTWPVMVMANGKRVLVQKRNGHPYVFLKEGAAKIQGYYKWDQQPEKFYIPEVVGNLDLTVNGTKVHSPNYEKNYVLLGQGFSSGNNIALKSENTLQVKVFRLVKDDHPIFLTTRLNLDISGTIREINLGPVLIDEFQPIGIDSGLPAFLNEKRELIIQAKPGSWVLKLHAYALPHVTSLTTPNNTKSVWPEQEVWAFKNNPEIRVATLIDLPVIDAESADLPFEWREYPSFLYEKGEKATIEEKVRGVPEDTNNQMTLNRNVWLSFNGQMWIFDDHISGRMRKDWRLEMEEPYLLEHAQENEESLLITTANNNKTGIEVRNPNLNISAMGIIEPINSMLVTGWSDRFDSVNWRINLPPAHRLIAAQGSESSSSWIEQWTLWNIFWVLLISVIAYRFTTLKMAAVTLVTLVLIFHETGAPIASFSSLLIAFVLHRAALLANGWLPKLTRSALVLSGLVFAVSFGLFFVHQVKIILHPQLEKTSPLKSNSSRIYSLSGPADNAMMMSEPAMETQMFEKEKMQDQRVAVKGSRIKPSLERYQKNTVIQMGSGKPAWEWQKYNLSWNSPVSQEQEVQLWIASPWLMVLWRVAAILGLLAVVLMAVSLSIKKKLSMQYVKQLLGAVVIVCCVPITSPEAQAEVPSEKVLTELKQWLHQPPECFPECVTISGMRIISSEKNGIENLSLELQVDAFDETVFPIPQSEHWTVQSVLIDGRAQNWMVFKNGYRWIKINKGRFKVELRGVLSGATQFNLAFPLVPHNVQNLSDVWELEGLINNNLKSNEIGFSKRASALARSVEDTESTNANQVERALSIEPMVKVEREIQLGSDWRMVTRVSRIAPLKGDLNLSIPLLSFEEVISSGVIVKDNQAKILIPSERHSVSWRSTLKPESPIKLKASEINSFVEEWIIQFSHQWRVSVSGNVPEVWPKQIDNVNWAFRYLPLKGEALDIDISKPEPVKGNVQSFDEVVISVSPGDYQRNVEMKAKYRSSRGGQSVINVGNGEQLNAIVDGRKEYLQIQDGLINYTMSPGEHQLDFNWRETKELGFKTVLPQVDLNAPMSNISVKWTVPRDRWVIWTQGPVIGPAIIYWGELLAFLLLAAIVWRTQMFPIPASSWLILGLGLSTQSWGLLVMITVWFIVLAVNNKYRMQYKPWLHNIIQIALVGFSVITLMALIASVPVSLLSRPDMGIAGNLSNGNLLMWYDDLSSQQTPEISVYSLPLWVYKLFMLAWALWLAFAIVKWARWGWTTMSRGEFWKPIPRKRKNESTDKSSSGDSISSKPSESDTENTLKSEPDESK
ncbi:hypothetical protein [Pleionea sediminis]|uniref:hypothetical protein n=1 Tax=Pleionea sediminis TaxID=2569479 RepID=UPI001186BD75|nr:hypothetical protein [Pleionea sediminis]